MSVGAFLCSFALIVAGNILVNLIFILLLEPKSGLFVAILVVSIIERIGISNGVTLFAMSLLIAIHKLYAELLIDN